MIIGYARVSTTEQNLDLQRDALKRAGCEKIIEDTVSGGKVQRPGLERVHDALRSGDVLAVYDSSVAEAFGNLASSPLYLSPAFLKVEPSSMNFRC